MKNILLFPINVFKYAFKGVKYSFKVLTGGTKDKNANSGKLEGEALIQELARVQAESKDFKRQDVEIEKKSAVNDVKLTEFKYVVKTSNGEKIKGSFEAATIDDVRIFLVNGGYEVISIEPMKSYERSINFGSGKIKNADLAFMLTQLSTYVKAGIPLIDSVRILSRQSSKPAQRKVLDKVVYELVMGEKFSSALEKQSKSFPKLLVNMVKTAEMTGDLSGTLDEMSDYYTEIEATRKQMISALVYPSVILTLAIGALAFIITVVVPQFTKMFAANNAKLPKITIMVTKLGEFMANNWYIVLIVLFVILIIYRWLYKNIKGFRKSMQIIFMKLPVIGKVIIYNEVTNLTRTFSSLLNHNVFITDSMEILSTLSENEIYKEIINRTLIGLSKGNKISETFRGEWAFPTVAYEMLVTGESTGQLALMMEKVANYYQELHKNAVTAIKSLIEPAVICLLAVGVGFIVLSIVIPMFELYQQL